MATKLQGMCGIAPGGAIMAATHKTNGAFEGAEGAICLYGSSGSPKSSFSSICVSPPLNFRRSHRFPNCAKIIWILN